jgi:hypothetical protein
MAKLGDPTMMRPATRRVGLNSDDPIGEYSLSNGRTVQTLWVHVKGNRYNILVWEVDSDNPAPMRVLEGVAGGITCSKETERLLVEFEALPVR